MITETCTQCKTELTIDQYCGSVHESVQLLTSGYCPKCQRYQRLQTIVEINRVKK